MYGSILDRRPAVGGLIQVRTPADIEYLVKESEVVTGHPVRKFVIYGADRLAYRIAWCPHAYQVEVSMRATSRPARCTCCPRNSAPMA